MQKLLVVAPNWVGDAVMSQPLLSALAARGDVSIQVLAPSWVASIYLHMAEVEGVIQHNLKHGSVDFGRRRDLARSVAAQHFDEAVVLPNSFKSALIPCLAGIPTRRGMLGELRFGVLTHRYRFDPDLYPRLVDRYFLLSGEPDQPPPPRAMTMVPKLQENDAWQRAGLRQRLHLCEQNPVLVLCPGAEYGPAKRWPVGHFKAVVARAVEQGMQVWVLGAQGDVDAGSAIIAGTSGGMAHNLCGLTTLSEAVDLLAEAHVVVSNDSGLMHIAAALGQPLIALFGSSSAKFTPPLSERAVILSVNMTCSPCFERTCHYGHYRCLSDITAEQVWERVQAFM